MNTLMRHLEVIAGWPFGIDNAMFNGMIAGALVFGMLVGVGVILTSK